MVMNIHTSTLYQDLQEFAASFKEKWNSNYEMQLRSSTDINHCSPPTDNNHCVI